MSRVITWMADTKCIVVKAIERRRLSSHADRIIVSRDKQTSIERNERDSRKEAKRRPNSQIAFLRTKTPTISVRSARVNENSTSTCRRTQRENESALAECWSKWLRLQCLRTESATDWHSERLMTASVVPESRPRTESIMSSLKIAAKLHFHISASVCVYARSRSPFDIRCSIANRDKYWKCGGANILDVRMTQSQSMGGEHANCID